MLRSQPRGGKRSVAHGVSHGERTSRQISPERGETPAKLHSEFRLAAAINGSQPVPTAGAVGYRSFAAQRLIADAISSIPAIQPVSHQSIILRHE
jgi:hypothetical protein